MTHEHVTAAHSDPSVRAVPGGSAGAETEALRIDLAMLWDAVCRVSGEYIAIIDRAGIIRSCSRVDNGFTIDQVVGHDLTRFTTPESSDQLRLLLHEVFETGEDRTLETTVRKLDGSLNYFSLRLGPILAAGRTVAVMACCENIRPLKTSESALRRERMLLQRLLEIQEKERALVAYEIHDGLAQYLAGALMHLQAFQHAADRSQADHEVDDTLRLLRAAAEESRRLIGGLRPPVLDELGITAAIEALVEETRAEIPDVSFVHSLPRRLPAQMEAAIFRIVQESLSNVRKHAAAGRVRLVVEATDTEVRLSVSDDGRGFDVAAVPEDRFGLEGIRQRCRLNGGEPQIESAPGRGTTITVTFPLHPEDG